VFFVPNPNEERAGDVKWLSKRTAQLEMRNIKKDSDKTKDGGSNNNEDPSEIEIYVASI